MSQRISIIDYGMGNLRSVAKAVEHVAGPDDEILITDDPKLILASDRVLFPGQGAARDCMAAISEHHLNQAILDAARSKPFLGICMGQQVLLEFSEENGGTPLLGLYAGQVRRFPGGRAPDGSCSRSRTWAGIRYTKPMNTHSGRAYPRTAASISCTVTTWIRRWRV
jgi:glutamine amidotransferase